MFKDKISMKGSLTIKQFDAEGKLVDQRDIHNLVVQAGKDFIASRMVDTSKDVMSHMAVGTGTVAPVAGDTTLQTELARVALTSVTYSANVITYVATYAPGVGTGALTEAGIFNHAVTGDLLCRTSFAVINKAAPDTVSVSWQISLQ